MILRSRLTPSSRQNRRGSLLSLSLALLLASCATHPTPASAQAIVASSATRTAIPRVDTQANQYQALYDYAPSAITEGTTHKVWWGGAGNRGTPDYTDVIYNATNGGDFYSGSWSTPQIVFRPSFVTGTFDRTHTCDPCIIKEGSTYYMYYGGLNDIETSSFQTAIGYATSTDGINWARQNSGKHIIQWKSPTSYGSAYGAGQPAVVKQGSWFYMIYTTVWRPSSGASPVGGEFAIRSATPAFRYCEERRKNSSGVTSWVPVERSGTAPLPLVRDSPLFGGDHVYDLTFLNQRNAFMAHSASGKVYFLDGNLNQVFNTLTISSPGYKEQRTIRRNPNGTVDQNSTNRYDLNFMAAKFTGPAGSEGNIFYYDIGTQNVSITVP